MTITELPKVETKKQFMDTLGVMNTPPKTEEREMGEIGRPRDLKSYILETNEKLEEKFYLDNVSSTISGTGLNHIKILTMVSENNNEKRRSQFYLDKSDKRFLVLHTNALARHSDYFLSKLTQSNNHEFDSAWLSTSMLKSISSSFGNKFYGYGVDYTDIFKEESEVIEPTDDLKMNISGNISQKVLEIIRKDESVDRTMGYTKVTIGRGTKYHGVLENLEHNGRFRVMKGDSIDDHISLVDYVTNEYSNSVHEIEKERIRGEKSGDKCFVEGTAFDFEFNRSIEDWNVYLPRIFNALEPFRIWGMKSEIDHGMHRILGVDMHTGDPLDIEVADHLMRVYLPKNSCGNVVLRLFVNLQRFLDSKITCSQIN